MQSPTARNPRRQSDVSRTALACAALACAGLVGLPATTASAQTTLPSASSTPATSESGLQDIIITAQRRVETSQRAAIAITSVGGDALVNAGVADVTRLGTQVPGLDAAASGVSNVVFLRGVGNFVTTPNSDASVATNYDGVYTGRTAPGFAFFDLARVEVLKGPQGTLYGRNATGGAINIIPERPKPGEFSGYGLASYGNYNDIQVEGALNVPLGAHGAFRVSGYVRDRDGYLQDGTNDDKSTAFRVQLLTEPTPALSIRVAADYSHQGGNGPGTTYLGAYAPGPGGFAFRPSGLPVSGGMFTPEAQAFRQQIFIAPTGRFDAPVSGYPWRRNDFYGMNAEITYDTGAGTLTFIPAWRYGHINQLSSSSSFTTRQREKIEQYSAELRFAGNRISIFDYMLGGYISQEKNDSLFIVSASALLSSPEQHAKANSYAPFARLTANLTDDLRLIGGIRYTIDKKSFRQNFLQVMVVCPAAPGAMPSCPDAPLVTPYVDNLNRTPFPIPAAGAPPLPVGGGAIAVRSDDQMALRLKNTRVTWRAAAEYDVAPQSLLYASVETGYRSGGFSGAVGFEIFEPEYLTAYTIGSKNRFFDNRLQLNIEGFYWDYTNQQMSFVGVDTAGNPGPQVRNIGASKIKGIETDLQLLATPSTLLRANIQYLDTRVKKLSYQTPDAGVPPITGCTVTPDSNPALLDVDCVGFPAFNSPKWTLNLGVQQTIDIGDMKLILAADTQYKTSQYKEFSYRPEVLVGSYWRSNAQITLAAQDDSWSVAGYIQNIENNRKPTWMIIGPLSNSLVTNPTTPRSYGLRLQTRF